MYLIIGLGNPGSEYDGTRHNVGFSCLDHLADKFDLIFSESKWQARTVKTVLWQQQVILAKPETFMNRSGDAVASLMQFYKVAIEHLIVVHDDIDLPFCRVKGVVGGGSGGHNGIRSIVEKTATNEFSRLKVGVGRPPGSVPADRYVLARFTADEQNGLENTMSIVEEGLRLFVREGITACMNYVNRQQP